MNILSRCNPASVNNPAAGYLRQPTGDHAKDPTEGLRKAWSVRARLPLPLWTNSNLGGLS